MTETNARQPTGLLEQQRLDALRAFEILDTPPDPRFDRLTKIARESFGVSISLVSLLDDCRQWFKSAQGLDVTETPREWAFCDHAIRQRDVMVIEDATADERFRGNPLVTGEPHIRFYAGAPLITEDGAALGTLCVIGTDPKRPSKAELQRLKDLAAIVVDTLEAHLESRNRNSVLSAMREMEKIAEQTALDFSAFTDRMLELGMSLFGGDNAFVSEIEGNDYHLIKLARPIDGMSDGDHLALENTLCASVVEDRTALAFHNIGDDPTLCHPALPKSDFQSYIGAPLIHQGHVSGSLSFAAHTPQPRPYADWQVFMISRMAESLAVRRTIQRAKDELANAREEVQMILDNVPARIWYKDDENRVLRANRAAAESVGYDNPDDLENTDTYDLFPDMASAYHETDLAVIKSGKPSRGTVVAYTPREGGKGWVRTDKIPLKSRNKKNRLLVVSTDVTELKTREQQLEQLNRSLKDFSFVAAHDLQAPLRQAAMFAELFNEALADRNITLGEETEQYFTGLTRGLEQMRGMVRSLHDLSRLESQEFTFSDFELDDVVSTAKARTDVPGKIVSTFEADPLPSVSGSKELLIQLMMNLFENSCKYTPGEHVTIRIRHKRDPAQLAHLISVEDNGVGIPVEAHQRIFEPFQRLHHKSDIEGTGIGLSLCRRIARLHNGSLTVDKTYENGARFILKLPIE